MTRPHPFASGFYAAAGGLAFFVLLRFGLRLIWPDDELDESAAA